MTPPNAMGRSTLIRRLLLAAAGAILIAVLAVFVGYRRLVTDPKPLAAALPESANLTMGQVTHSATRNGRTEWRLKATSATLTDGQKHLELTAPDVVYYTEDGREIFLTAKHGTLDTTTNNMTADGRIRVQDGRYQLETEALEYNHNQKIVTCPVPVKLFSEASEATGDRMAYDMNTGRIELKGHVDVHLRQNLHI